LRCGNCAGAVADTVVGAPGSAGAGVGVGVGGAGGAGAGSAGAGGVGPGDAGAAQPVRTELLVVDDAYGC